MSRKDRTSRRQNPNHLKKQVLKQKRETTEKIAVVETEVGAIDIDAINTSLGDLDARLTAVEP